MRLRVRVRVRVRGEQTDGRVRVLREGTTVIVLWSVCQTLGHAGSALRCPAGAGSCRVYATGKMRGRAVALGCVRGDSEWRVGHWGWMEGQPHAMEAHERVMRVRARGDKVGGGQRN